MAFDWLKTRQKRLKAINRHSRQIQVYTPGQFQAKKQVPRCTYLASFKPKSRYDVSLASRGAGVCVLHVMCMGCIYFRFKMDKVHLFLARTLSRYPRLTDSTRFFPLKKKNVCLGMTVGTAAPALASIIPTSAARAALTASILRRRRSPAGSVPRAPPAPATSPAQA